METNVHPCVKDYIQLWSERDADTRKRIIEGCFAKGGRIVTPGRTISGREELETTVSQFLGDKNVTGIRVTSPIDCGRSTFRFHTLIEHADGSKAPGFDAGELDEEGRILLILTFGGLLVETYPANTAVE